MCSRDPGTRCTAASAHKLIINGVIFASLFVEPNVILPVADVLKRRYLRSIRRRAVTPLPARKPKQWFGMQLFGQARRIDESID